MNSEQRQQSGALHTWARIMNRKAAIVLLVLLSFWLHAPLLSQERPQAEAVAEIKVATFDSGFGGFFTAKSIEQTSRRLIENYHVAITIKHYGDTKNVPYGEKTPAQIVSLASAGVIKALSDGADMVFIACNTASTQYEGIRAEVERAYPGRGQDVASIIDVSVAQAKMMLDRQLEHSAEAHFVILATPATVKSMAYPRRLAALYHADLQPEEAEFFTQKRWFKENGAVIESVIQKSVIRLPQQKTIYVYQLAPGNWVELIEHGADQEEKNSAVARDLALLFSRLPNQVKLDVVGYFCTHYPVFDAAIRQEIAHRQSSSDHVEFIFQGPLMAELFKGKAEARLNDYHRTEGIGQEELARRVMQSRVSIAISGGNTEVVRQLARTLFPQDPVPQVVQEEFAAEKRK